MTKGTHIMTKGKTQKWLAALLLGLLIVGVSSIATANGREMDKVSPEKAQLVEAKGDKGHDGHDHDKDRDKDHDKDRDKDKDKDHKGHDHNH
jgi:hypothetical protein